MATGASVWLEASDDGKNFRRIVDIPRNGAPQQTLAISPITARAFRLVHRAPDAAAQHSWSSWGFLPAPAPTAHEVLELSLHSAPRIHRFEDKAGFTNRAIAAAEDTPAVDAEEAVAKNDVVDLTAKLRADGTLDWTPPPGRWIVLRFGYSLTGRSNHPASREGTGLEVDKLNRKHVKSYFDAYLAEYDTRPRPGSDRPAGPCSTCSPIVTKRVSRNWTDDILEQFEKRRGYNPVHGCRRLSGACVGSAADSDRFLWDFRQTLGDLIADEHYGYLSEMLRDTRDGPLRRVARRRAGVPRGWHEGQEECRCAHGGAVGVRTLAA